MNHPSPQGQGALTIGLAPAESLIDGARTSRAVCMPVLLRFALYTGLLLATTAGLLQLLMVEDTIEQELFREGGLVERGQLALAAITAAVLGLAGRRWRVSAPVLWVLALLVLIACVRESDHLFKNRVPVLGWKLPAGLLLAGIVVLIHRHWEAFWSQAVRWLHTPAFGVLWAGAIMVLVFAQLMGQVELWQGVMGDAYERAFKRTVEESAETFGYALLLIGATECWWQAPVLDRHASASGQDE